MNIFFFGTTDSVFYSKHTVCHRLKENSFIEICLLCLFWSRKFFCRFKSQSITKLLKVNGKWRLPFSAFHFQLESRLSQTLYGISILPKVAFNSTLDDRTSFLRGVFEVISGESTRRSFVVRFVEMWSCIILWYQNFFFRRDSFDSYVSSVVNEAKIRNKETLRLNSKKGNLFCFL